jgi:hypothetical protein
MNCGGAFGRRFFVARVMRCGEPVGVGRMSRQKTQHRTVRRPKNDRTAAVVGARVVAVW